MNQRLPIAIIGGGLAGMAAAARLREKGLAVELFEAQAWLGGRAASFSHKRSGQLIDHCQHVGMGCCTNLIDFCRRMQVLDCLKRYETLHFFDRRGRRFDISPQRLLPAPFHLLPSFWRLAYLSPRDRFSVARGLARLVALPSGKHVRLNSQDHRGEPSAARWLVAQSQSPAAMRDFWQPILVSALGDLPERVSVHALRQVFVDGLLCCHEASHLLVPQVTLRELYGVRVRDRLIELGVAVNTATRALGVRRRPEGGFRIELAGQAARTADCVVLAIPWCTASRLAPPDSPALTRRLEDAARGLASSPISGVHLWYDRRFTPLPHAVLVGRFSQWVFARPPTEEGFAYYQVVISASHALASLAPSETIARVTADLEAVWPAARAARLIDAQVVSERRAVFSPQAGCDHLRPPQQTELPGFFLCGDWTASGWPSTMEGAVRSGYLAAEAVLRFLGQGESLLIEDLPRGLLARWLLGNRMGRCSPRDSKL